MKILITTIEQLRKYVKINASKDFDTYEPFITDAQLKYVLPYFGEKLLDDLSSKSDDVLTIKILRALAPFSLAIASPELSINFGEAGHTVTRTDKLAPASDNKIAQAVESLFQRAWLNLDDALKYVFNHQADYPQWTESDFVKKNQTGLFKNAEDFQENGMVDIDNSPLTFHRLRMIISRVERSETFPLVNNLSISDKLLSAMKAYTGSRVASVFTSQTTRIQRSQPKTEMEFTPIIRPVYDDTDNSLNYYEQQAAYWRQEIQNILISEKVITPIDTSIYFNSEDKRIFVAGAKREV